MIDFLRSNPWCSREEYTWGLSVAQIKLASYDFTHIEYLMSEEDRKKRRKNTTIVSGGDARQFSDLGVPII